VFLLIGLYLMPNIYWYTWVKSLSKDIEKCQKLGGKNDSSSVETSVIQRKPQDCISNMCDICSPYDPSTVNAYLKYNGKCYESVSLANSSVQSVTYAPFCSTALNATISAYASYIQVDDAQIVIQYTLQILYQVRGNSTFVLCTLPVNVRNSTQMTCHGSSILLISPKTYQAVIAFLQPTPTYSKNSTESIVIDRSAEPVIVDTTEVISLSCQYLI